MTSWTKRIGTAALILVMGTVLAACGTSPSDKLFSSFEKAAGAETAAANSFNQLKQLEEKDQKQYDTILNKGERSSVNVQTLIVQTASTLDQRQQAMTQVKQQLTAAYEHVEGAQSQVDKLEAGKGKEQAAQALTAYTKRNETMQKLSSQYEALLTSERKLYETLKADKTNIKEIQQAVKDRNQAWVLVNQSKKQFNSYTEQFNSNKSAFYQAAGIQTDKAVSSK